MMNLEGRKMFIQLKLDGYSNVVSVAAEHGDELSHSADDGLKWLRSFASQNDEPHNQQAVNICAQSTDFTCTFNGCSYHHQSETRFILHMRSHFVFEVSHDAKTGTDFSFTGGKYVCSRCPRTSSDQISFREHIRHHLLSKPYRCSFCELSVISIPALRKHFQENHPRQPADFKFNGDQRSFTGIMTVLSGAQIADTAMKFEFAEEGSCHPLSVSPTTIQKQHTNFVGKNADTIDAPNDVLKNWKQSLAGPLRQCHNQKPNRKPGKYLYRCGTYSCVTCNFRTSNTEAFRKHAWNHVHDSWTLECRHNANKVPSQDCSVINGLIGVLKGIDQKFGHVEPSIRTPGVINNVTVTKSVAASSGGLAKKACSIVAPIQPLAYDVISDAKSCSPSTGRLEAITPEVVCKDTSSGHLETGVGKSVLSAPKYMLAKSDRNCATCDTDDIEVTVMHDQIPLKMKCNDCSFTCNNENQLKYHLKTGHGCVGKPDRFNCPECNMSTPKKDTLIWHLSHHLGDHKLRYFVCSSCEAEFQQKSEIDLHIAKKHKSERSCTSVSLSERVAYLQCIMKCPICGSGLLWKSMFISHIKSFHQLSDLALYLSQNYSDSCPDGIRFPGRFARVTSEPLVDPGSSVIASHSSTTPTKTNGHIIGNDLHALVSRFHCDLCDFSTNDKESFVVHQGTHIDISSNFTSGTPGGSLSRTVSSYKCEYCSFSSSNQNDYTYHVAKHTPRDVSFVGYRCAYCTYTDNRQIAVSRHVQQCHPHSIIQERAESVSETDLIKTKKPAVSAGVAKKSTSKNQTRNLLLKAAIKGAKGRRNAGSSSASSRSPSVMVGSEKIATLPKSLQDSTLAEFEKTLPDSFVFSEDMKCPKCYFTSRVRVNLMRHLKSHDDLVTQERPSTKAKSQLHDNNESLSFNLWPAATTNPEVPLGRRPSAGSNEKSTGGSSSKRASVVTDESERTLHLRPDTVKQSVASDCEPRQFSCESCELSSQMEVELERHISKSHSGPYICHLCGMLLWLRSSVCQHYSTEHPGEPPMFEVLHKKKNSDETKFTGILDNNKVARIQGILRTDELNPDGSLMERATTDDYGPSSRPNGAFEACSHNETNNSMSSAAVVSSISSAPASASLLEQPSSLTTTEPALSFPSTLSGTPNDMLLAALEAASGLPQSALSGMTAPSQTSGSTDQLPWQMALGGSNLMAALGSMNSVALLATQLVPILANMDVQVLLSMMRVANPDFAAALGAMPPRSFDVSSINQQLINVFSQLSSCQSMQDGIPSNSLLNMSSSSSQEQNPMIPSTYSNIMHNNAADGDSRIQASESFQAGSSVTSSYAPSRSASSITGYSSDTESVGLSESSRPRSESFGSLPDVSRSIRRSVRSRASVSSESDSDDQRRTKRRRMRKQDGRHAVAYRCHKCPFLSSNRKRFAEHMYEELSDGRRTPEDDPATLQRCSHCAFSTFLSDEFTRHVSSHAMVKRNRCVYCAYAAVTTDMLKKHLSRNHPGRPFARDVEPRRRSRKSADVDKTRLPSVLDLDPVIQLVDVLKLNPTAIKKLKTEHHIQTINL